MDKNQGPVTKPQNKTKNRIPEACAWCNQLLFELITIFDNCIIVKSH
jgi:hypothetical protein